MRFGLCTSIDNIEHVKRLGFDYLEVPVTKIADLTDAELKEKLKKVKSAGIQVVCCNILFPKTFCLLDPANHWTLVNDYLHRAFERIQMLQGEIVVFGSGKCRTCIPEIQFDQGHRKLVEIIKKTAIIAAKYGLTLVIEPLNSSESNTVNTVAEGAMVRADVNMENVDLLADSYHMFRENEPMSNINRVGSLRHTHVALLEGRKYPTVADSKLAAFFKALKEIGYDGSMSIEGKTEDFEKDAVKALSVLKELDSLNKT